MENTKKRNDVEEIDYIKRRLQMGHLGTALMETDEEKNRRNLLAKRNKAEEDRKEFIKGYETIIKEIDNKTKEGEFSLSDEIGPTSEEECRMSEELRKIAENPQEWKELYDRHEISALSGFSDKAVLDFYAIGTMIFEEKKHKDALSVFSFLSILNPSIPTFWIGKGLCHEADLAYDKAIDEFEHGSEADRSSFAPFLGILRCSQHLKDYSRAIDLLNLQKENGAIKNEVNEALEYIKMMNNR